MKVRSARSIFALCSAPPLLLLACSAEFVGGHATGGVAGIGPGGTSGTSGSGGTETGGIGGVAPGGTAGIGGIGGVGGAAGAGGSAGTVGGGTGGIGGTGGNVVCGDGQCGPNEVLSCVPDCAEWYYVATATNPGSTPGTDPHTWRGDLTLTSKNTFSVSFTNTIGQTAVEPNHFYSLTSNYALNVDNAGEGQISPDADLMAIGGIATPLQTVAVRKGNGLSNSSIQGSYRVRGITGDKASKSIYGMSATLNFDSNGCLLTGSAGQLTDSVSPLAITFVPATGSSGKGCATVSSTGAIALPHQQASNNGTVDSTFEGWVGAGGDIILWTHDETTGFEPGTILAVRETAGHSVSNVGGTYFATHVLDVQSIRATIDLSGGSVTGGMLSMIGTSGISVTGGSYTVTPNGNFAATVVDTVSTAGSSQAGQAANFDAVGVSQVLVSSIATKQNPNAAAVAPSLMVWVRRP